jgi:DNA-binding GntR family transcriptional regulator
MERVSVVASNDAMIAGPKVHDQVYQALSEWLIQGDFAPLKPVSLRTLAHRLGVSPMPVREAVRRLITEKALELQPANKRLRVPALSEDRLRQLSKARAWVEAELAFMAAGSMTPKVRTQVTSRMKTDDERVMEALKSGDVSAYMHANHDFHFTLYKAAGADLLLDMARMLWLQSGPFMRVVFGRLGTVNLPQDHHQLLIKALETGDAEAARAAMHDDVLEGMDLLMEAIRADAAPARRVAGG